jgi:hypothetical protein
VPLPILRAEREVYENVDISVRSFVPHASSLCTNLQVINIVTVACNNNISWIARQLL